MVTYVQREIRRIREEGRREGFQEGLQEARQEGYREGMLESVQKMLAKDFAPAQIADILGLPLEQVLALQESQGEID